jgi:hypothetical protein
VWRKFGHFTADFGGDETTVWLGNPKATIRLELSAATEAKVNFQHAIHCQALRGANMVTPPRIFGGTKPLYSNVWIGKPNATIRLELSAATEAASRALCGANLVTLPQILWGTEPLYSTE